MPAPQATSTANEIFQAGPPVNEPDFRKLLLEWLGMWSMEKHRIKDMSAPDTHELEALDGGSRLCGLCASTHTIVALCAIFYRISAESHDVGIVSPLASRKP